MALLAACAPAALAQKRVLGASECVRCHKHSLQATQWQTKEPAALGGNSHFGTLDKLKTPRAIELAQKAGLDGPRNARCTVCHATVVGGRPRSGVSCESCHGAASDYMDVHQKPDSYAASVAAGLKDLRVKPENIATLCVSCHVLGDKDVRAAGHPVGEKFDAGASLRKIEHWSWEVRQTKIDPAQVGRLAQAAGARIAGAGGSAAPKPGATAPPAAPASGNAAPAAPRTPVPAFNPNQATALPDDYVEPVAKRRAAPVEDAPAPASFVTRSGGQAQLVPAAPKSAPPAPPAEPRSGASRATTADVVKARQSALELARALAAAGESLDKLPAAGEYLGPDGELLRIQDEALALLRRAKASPPAKEDSEKKP